MKTLVKVKVLNQLLYLSKSNKVQVPKCTLKHKTKKFPPEGHFCAKLIELYVILT